MTKRKGTNGQTTIYKTQKTKVWTTRTPLIPGESQNVIGLKAFVVGSYGINVLGLTSFSVANNLVY